MRDLTARIERLEAKRPHVWPRTHRLIQDEGEDRVTAYARYERESGITIGPDDFVIIHVIVAPTWEASA